MEAGITNQLLSLGLPGIIILVLGGVCLYLYKRIEKLQTTVNELQEKKTTDINAIQEQRIKDLKELTLKLSEVIERNTAVMERNTDVLESIKALPDEPKRKGASK